MNRKPRPRIIRAIETGRQVEIQEVYYPDKDETLWNVLVADGRKMGSGTGRRMLLISHWYTQEQAFCAAASL